MKIATWKSSALVGMILGIIAGLAAIFESWVGLLTLVILFFFTVYKWVFGAETFVAIKEEKKRRGLYWFEPMDKFSDLQSFGPLFGRMLVFFIAFTLVVISIIVPAKMPNQPVETTAAPLPFSSFATSAYSPPNHVLAHPRLT